MPIRRSNAYCLVSLSLLLAVLASLVAVPVFGAQAVTVDLPPVTIPPGQSVTLSIKAFCITYGSPFSPTFPPPTGMADPKFVNILRYSLSKGYTESAPYQVQLAIWRAQTGQWVNPPGTSRVIAEEIYNNASQAPAPPASPYPSLLDAMQAGTVSITYQNWTPIQGNLPNSVQPWLGTGDMIVTNKTTSPLILTLPQGMFMDAAQGKQDMLAYFVRVQLPATPTPTPTATPLPMPPTGIDTPDDVGYLGFVVGGLLFISGLAYDIYRRRRALAR